MPVEDAGGAHPDGTNIIGNVCNSANGAFVKITAPLDTAGALGPDACVVAYNRTIQVPTPIEFRSGQGCKVFANRFENTTGSLTITVETDNPVNAPTAGCTFIANEYAYTGTLTFTDNSVDGCYREAEFGTGGWKGTTPTVASAGTLVLKRNNVQVISGTTTITSINVTYPGHRVTLVMSSTAQITDGSNLKLAGNFTGAADRTITIVCDGTNWYKVGRSAN